MERFCYKGFLRNSFGAKFFVGLTEASPLDDVRFREVPLYSNDMDGIYKNIKEYNPNKKCKILIVFDDMITDMLSNKSLNPIVIWIS